MQYVPLPLPNVRLRAEQEITQGPMKRMPDAHFVRKIKSKKGNLSLTQSSS